MRRSSVVRLAVVVVFLALASVQARAGEVEDAERYADCRIRTIFAFRDLCTQLNERSTPAQL